MRNRSRRAVPYHFSFFRGKVICFLLLLLVQNLHSQIFISDGAFIHLEKDVLVSLTDSLFSSNPKSKIYISSGVKIYNIEALINFEIVEIKKAEVKKQLVLKNEKLELEKSVEQKIVSKKDNSAFRKYIYSNFKSELYFCFIGGFSKVTIPALQLNIKQVISSEGYQISLSYRRLRKLTLKYFKRPELFSSKNKFTFWVRPPPFLS